MKGILSVIILVADVYALYNIITSGSSLLKKVIWCAVVLILPVLGFFIWLIFGPRSGSGGTRT